MNQTKEDYINYRIEKAEQTMLDARLLFENERYNSAVNRLYYACFYLVNALLSLKDNIAHSHAGVRTQFYKEYIKTNMIDRNLGKLYSDLFDWRQEADYADFTEFDKETVEKLFADTEFFFDSLKRFLSA